MKIRDELLPGRFLKKEFASQEGYRLMDEDETLTKIMYAMRDCRSSAPIHNTSSRGEIFNNDDDSDDNNHNNGDEEETSHDVNEYEQEHAHEPFLKRFNHGQMKDDDDDNDEVYTDTNEAVEEALTDNEEEQLYLNEDEGEEDVVEEYDAGNKNYNQEYDVPPSRLGMRIFIRKKFHSFCCMLSILYASLVYILNIIVTCIFYLLYSLLSLRRKQV